LPKSLDNTERKIHIIAMEDTPKTYPVSKYLASIKKLLDTKVPQIWVHGVVTQVVERGRIVYLNIAEFVEGDVKPVASLPLYIFTPEFVRIQENLASLPKPFIIKDQIKVNILIEADLYVPYGKFQARLVDIDPSFTIGELTLTRQAILKRLTEEGLLRLNATREFAAVPLNVGLITGEGTAAYQDFCTTLQNSHFAFQITPAFARMQGNDTETTILEALGTLRANEDLDVICIIRGGGSKTDLNYFDSEALCRAVAQFPTPVLTGIGHEIDQSLLDLVAWEACITPTDCAKKLIKQVELSWEKTQDLAMEIATTVRTQLAQSKDHLRQVQGNLTRQFSTHLVQERERLASSSRILLKMPFRILKTESELITRNKEGLRFGVQKLLQLEKSRFALMEQRVKTNDPKTILAKGYSLTTRKDGKLLRHRDEVQIGDRLTTHLENGSVESIVQ
jgi:exodeoxyribonuclease VII large subunit